MTDPVGAVPGNLIDWSAGVIGIPSSVVSAQITDESNGQPDAVSSTGAQGVAQFEPGTWKSLGCAGSPFTVSDAMKCYAKFMYQLVQQYNGNVRDALAAYNAGPGNISAGYGYADSILRSAGQTSALTAKGGSGAGASAEPGTSAGGVPAGPECLWSFGGQHLGIFFGHGPSLPSTCIISKSEFRAFIGALILVSGTGIMLPGIVIIVAYAVQKSGAVDAATKAAGMVPGYGGMVGKAASGARAGTKTVPAVRGAARGARARPAQQSSGAGAGTAASTGASRPRAVPKPAAGRYRVTEKTGMAGEMGGTRTVTYTTNRRPRATQRSRARQEAG